MDIEHGHQVALIRWWVYFSNSLGIDQRLLAAIPNGGHRHPAVAAKMKAEGVRPGMPDLFLFFPARGYHGLGIEMKAPTKTARVSPAQTEMMGLLACRGYLVVVAKGVEDAIAQIKWYLADAR